MHPTKLRVAGFKSFVEPAELRIEAGVTGIVGPNGCGKSNLVEALRWVMGETAPRQVRGGGMEDVIFGGTAHRPPRDTAEVALTLDNAGRTAPPAFNDAAEIEVTRRIERAEGSTYVVNGSEVRARDVSSCSPTSRPALTASPWSGRGASATSSARSRPGAGRCWKRRPASPACTRAGTRRSSSCGRRKPTWSAFRT